MINEPVYIVVAIISVICYFVIRYAKISIKSKDVIHIALGVMALAITFYALIHDDGEYLLAFLAAEYIFKAFDTTNDE